MQTVNVAIVGLAIAYAGATAAFLNKEALKSINPWLIAFLPSPLWIVAVFLGIFSGAQARRGPSSIILERKLVDIAQLNENEVRAVGLTGTESVMGFRKGSLFVKSAIFITFGGEVLVTISYTGLMLYQAHARDPAMAVWLIPTAIYTALIGILITTVVANERGRRECARSTGIL